MIRKLLCFLFVFSLLLTSKYVAAQASDFQCTPTDLGTLPFASPCASGTGFTTGAIVTQTATTVSATSDSLSGMITSCYVGTPLKDVWYSFTATENHVQIMLEPIGATPLSDSYVGIYEGLSGECVGLMPRDCSMSSGTSTHLMEFGPLTFGVKYYLQIASGIPGGNGSFKLTLNTKNVCADCSKNSILQAYPMPVRAAYHPDTTVGFCYSVVGYNGQFGNALHGVVPLFGSGWDATSITIYQTADSVDMLGQWKWFNGINIPGTGLVSGFFYDVGGDNDPTNNLGDHGSSINIWTFCFSIKTQTKTLCNSGQTDLSIRFMNFADGESGSLVSASDCSGDKDYVFDAHMECCPKPYGAFPQAAGCNSSADGSITAYAGLSIFGHDYFLYDNSGALVATHTSASFSASPYVFSGLFEGNYYLYMNENTAGACQTALNIYVPGPVDYSVNQIGFGCFGAASCLNSALISVNTGGVSSINWSNGSVGTFADSLCPGWNTFTIIDTGVVACTIIDSVFIINLPNANPSFQYEFPFYCTSDSTAVISDFPAAGGGTFALFGALPAGITVGDINPSTGTINITGATGAGYLVVKYTSPPPCSNNFIDTIYIQPSPPQPLASEFADQNLCVGDAASPYFNSSIYDVNWYNDTALSSLVAVQTPGSSYSFFSALPFTVPGNYSFFILNSSVGSPCKSIPLSVTVNIAPLPIVDAGGPLTVCPGLGINLTTSGNANAFVWSPAGPLNNATLPGPTATLTSTTLFTVVGTDATSGCSATDTVTVFVDENGACDIVLYNGFTPNGDNQNDFWFIGGIAIDPKNQVSIFNRWGHKIWETVGYDNTENKWEGRSSEGNTILPDGTYFYVIRFKDKTYKGYVELTK